MSLIFICDDNQGLLDFLECNFKDKFIQSTNVNLVESFIPALLIFNVESFVDEYVEFLALRFKYPYLEKAPVITFYAPSELQIGENNYLNLNSDVDFDAFKVTINDLIQI